MTSFILKTWRAPHIVKATKAASLAGATETVAAATLRAQVLAPRDTGFMANTIQFEPAEAVASGVSAMFGNWTAEYTLWNEIGTSRMPARPFLRPAADAEFPQVGERIKQHMRGVR